jgi:hypothetical protein
MRPSLRARRKVARPQTYPIGSYWLSPEVVPFAHFPSSLSWDHPQAFVDQATGEPVGAVLHLYGEGESVLAAFRRTDNRLDSAVTRARLALARLDLAPWYPFPRVRPWLLSRCRALLGTNLP